jgi:hypothetical protein
MTALPRPPVWIAVLFAPAAVDGAAIALTVLLAMSLGRDPNLETTFLLVPIPMARVLLGLADSYSLTGSRRTWAVFVGIVASIGWWIVALLAAAWVAAMAAA